MNPLRRQLGHSLGQQTHVCPTCGDWFIVHQVRSDAFRVYALDSVIAWDEAAMMPICPYDGQTELKLWLIDE